jgi:hypothetical protein
MYESELVPDQSTGGNDFVPTMRAGARVPQPAILLPPFDHLLIAHGAVARSVAG